MDDETLQPEADGRFERFARTVADLDSAFYDEERERDVWNEASAVGFQVALLGVMLVAAGALWIAGATAAPFVAASLVPLAGAVVVTYVYAARRGVNPANQRTSATGAGRRAAWGLVAALLAGGFVRAAAQGAVGSSGTDRFLRGMEQGAAVTLAVVALAVLIMWAVARRRGSDGHG